MMSSPYIDSSIRGYEPRTRCLMLVAAVIFAAYLVRLAQLQLIEGDELREILEQYAPKKGRAGGCAKVG